MARLPPRNFPRPQKTSGILKETVHAETSNVDPWQLRTSILYVALPLLLLDVATKMLFARAHLLEGEFITAPSSMQLIFALIIVRCVPAALAFVWHSSLRRRLPYKLHTHALAALFVAPVGGLFEYLYFGNHSYFFSSAFNLAILGDIAEAATVIGSIVLLVATLRRPLVTEQAAV